MMRLETQPAISDDAWEAVRRKLVLSGREFQIVRLLMQDLKEIAIARILEISPHTVHTHVNRLYHKLNVSSRIELVVRLVEYANTLRCLPGGQVEPLCANRTAGKCPFAK